MLSLLGVCGYFLLEVHLLEAILDLIGSYYYNANALCSIHNAGVYITQFLSQPIKKTELLNGIRRTYRHSKRVQVS